jgi:hypothetical protein
MIELDEETVSALHTEADAFVGDPAIEELLASFVPGATPPEPMCDPVLDDEPVDGLSRELTAKLIETASRRDRAREQDRKRFFEVFAFREALADDAEREVAQGSRASLDACTGLTGSPRTAANARGRY